MANSAFFENRKPWSARKHRLLGKYLPPFSAKVAYTTSDREIYVIDGFAGAARYDDGSKGSPVLIAEFGDICSSWRNPVTLKLVNVEADKNSEGIFEKLKEQTAEWVVKGRVVNIQNDFAAAIPEILQLVGNSPSLFFVDPFGPTDLRFQALLPILSRQYSVTELIINFDQDGLRRIVDAALSPKTDKKTADTNARNISEIVGSDGWRARIEGADLTSSQAEAILINEYSSNLVKFGFSVVAYPIREELASTPKYHFVFCTRHPDGLVLMNDFIREEEDNLYGEHVANDLPLFSEESSLANEIINRRTRLTTVIRDYINANRVFTRGQLKDDLIVLNFGHFHTKEYASVVQSFVDSGDLLTGSGKKRINDKEPLRRK